MSAKEKNAAIKKIIEQMPLINQRTLKFICIFFQEVVDYEPSDLDKEFPEENFKDKGNRMTAYNIAVTVGPNIFRENEEKPSSIMRHGVYYDAFIRMIENVDTMFSVDSDTPEIYDFPNCFQK